MKATRLQKQCLTAVVACLFIAPGLVQAESHDSENTIEVTATDFAFEPSTIEVGAGETVEIRLVNEGATSHNLHVHLDGEEVRTETLQSGNSDTLTFTAPETGEYEFYCAVPGHKAAGMVGEMVVED